MISYNPFLKQLNEQHQTIKFGCKTTKVEIAVLETKIYLMKKKIIKRDNGFMSNQL